MSTDYLGNLDAFLAASRQFQRALATEEELTESIDELERTSNLAGKTGYRSFRFTGNAGEPAQKEHQSPQEATVGLLFEIRTATVLVAAGRALEDAPAATHASAELRQAVAELDTARRELTPTPASSWRRFSAESPSVEATTAAAADPIESFRSRSKATLEALVSGAHGALIQAVTSLAKLDPSRVAQALGNFGRKSETLKAVGRLIKRGIEKLKAALDALGRLLGQEALEKIKGSVQKVWKDAQEQQLTKKALAWALGTEATERQVDQSLGQQGLDPAALARGLDALAALDVQYARQMAVLEDMTKALAFAATILALTPLAGSAVPFLAGGYLLLIASILLIGMDYADSGKVLRWVHGVGEIANELRALALRT